MQLPNNVTPGQAISAKDFNSMLAALRSLELRGGPGVLVQKSSGGTTVSLLNDKEPVLSTPSEGGTYKPPFKCEVISGSLKVEPGYVNNLMPKYAGVGLDASPSITLTNNATNYVYLKVTGSFNLTTGTETVTAPIVEVHTTSKADTAISSSWLAYGLLTNVTLSSGAVSGSVPSYFTSNLKAANFGAMNSYYAT